jgi:hypothetical protein
MIQRMIVPTPRRCRSFLSKKMILTTGKTRSSLMREWSIIVTSKYIFDYSCHYTLES